MVECPGIKRTIRAVFRPNNSEDEVFDLCIDGYAGMVAGKFNLDHINGMCSRGTFAYSARYLIHQTRRSIKGSNSEETTG